MSNLIYKQGDLFTSEAAAFGHGVNTVGLMGAGIAKTFRKLYPDMYETYHTLCKQNILKTGSVLPFRNDDGRYIMNMATQDKPGRNARYEWVDSALNSTLSFMSSAHIKSLAIPRIGCGIGGLDWVLVDDIIVNAAKQFPQVDIEIWSN